MVKQAGAAPARRRGAEWLALLFPWAAGIVAALHPSLLSGLQEVQTDLGDTRLVIYLMEHGYRWLTGALGEPGLWNPPFFFPALNTLAYADTFLGAAPFYWVARVLGADRLTAMQFWQFAVLSCNYLAAVLALRRAGGFDPWPAAMGAFLFAFGAPRINQMSHPQLLPHFFTVLVLFAAARLVGGCPAGAAPGRGAGQVRWLLLAAVSLAGQLYAGFYLTWFLVFALSLALIWCLILPGARPATVAWARRHAGAVAGAAAACGLLCLPLLLHYGAARADLGGRSAQEVAGMLPRLASWFHAGPSSWLYGWSAGLPWFQLPVEWEQRLGLGLGTSLAVTAGLLLLRRTMWMQVVLLTTASLWLMVTSVGGWSLWWAVYHALPGASAVRAVSRAGVMMLLPAALGLALILQHLGRAGKLRAAILLGTLCAAEQGVTTQSFHRLEHLTPVQALAESLERLAGDAPGGRCSAFLYNVNRPEEEPLRHHLDAMLAQQATGIPTLNGYSGQTPPGWPLSEVLAQDSDQAWRLQRAAEAWLRAGGRDPAGLCVPGAAMGSGRDNATILSQHAPARVFAGEVFTVEVRVRNDGQSTWSQTDLVRLGLQLPAGEEHWGPGRVDLTGLPVQPGMVATLRFPVQAPLAEGRRMLRWRMVREHVHWFGTYSSATHLEVHSVAPTSP